MNNELTPQEKHPKFYSHPHYWINAIEVKSIKDYPVFGQNGVTKKRVYKLTHNNFTEFIADGDLKDYAPLFKPQEGEAFIKDLEAAVSAGGNGDFKLLSNRLGYKWFITDASDNFHTHLYLTVKDSGISVVSSYANFDTTAYVDKLRELGYYI